MKYKKFIWIFVAFIGLSCDRVQTDIGLNKAAHSGNIQKVIKLLSAGSKVNGKGWDGETPLHNASSAGHLEIVQLLLVNNAQINPICWGKTPVDRAKKPEIENLLRQHGGKTAEELKATKNGSKYQ